MLIPVIWDDKRWAEDAMHYLAGCVIDEGCAECFNCWEERLSWTNGWIRNEVFLCVVEKWNKGKCALKLKEQIEASEQG